MTVKTDGKKRVVIPEASPGEVYDVQEQGEGRYLLVRLERPEAPGTPSRAECLRAIEEQSLTPEMSWEELRSLTREP